ncbi:MULTISPECIES: trigger factor [Flavobacteriaceae]|uniref:Trigger factor n=2 Tax=Flavobacteriaceae TaxID=49546 RepID=A0A4Y8AR02_9FLAO|nr:MULTISPECIES: trigger factor [Flavobacteriaceae]TEW72463.1 trigger factor [Gramella jeungdoensis]GGK55584.1 peptidylprolyl isomerase [Lutibacter litoralis]
MNITKESVDALNAVVKVEISAADYQDKVEKILQDYRQKADIPGFRKGHVPMGMVKKQYGKSIMIDEVNKLLQESLNKYLVEEKLDILGNPLPKMQDDFSWDTEDYSFEFELGLAPEFDVDLEAKKKITQYNIVADKELLDKEVENIQKRFGKIVPQEVVEEGVNIAGTFANEEKGIDKKSTIELASIKGKVNQKKFIGAKVGDIIELKSKGLFDDDHKLMGALGLNHEEIQDLDIPLTFTIEEISVTELAEVNQELFDKVFGPDVVKSEEELREKIKEDAEKQFQTQADQQLLNAVTEYLVENTKFDLPAEFLKKWLAVAGEKPISAEQAAEEYEKSEKGLRYQLIEGKVLKDNNIKLDFEELKDFTKGFVKAQMAQYGQLNPEEKELDDIVQRVLSNQDEAKRLQEQLVSQKLLAFYKEKITFKVKEMSYEAFVKEVYK